MRKEYAKQFRDRLSEPSFDPFDQHLPDWARRKARANGLEEMQQLCTKDGRLHGNATVVDISIRTTEPMLDLFITVVTDAGNIIENYSLSEVQSGYYFGNFVMKGFPTTEATEAVERWIADRYNRPTP